MEQDPKYIDVVNHDKNSLEMYRGDKYIDSLTFKELIAYGGTSGVFTANELPGVCIKKVSDYRRYDQEYKDDIANTYEGEIGITYEAHQLTKSLPCASVEAVGFYEDEYISRIALNLIEGLTLEQVFTGRTVCVCRGLDMEKVRSLNRDVVYKTLEATIQVLHVAGIVHGDIAPRNFMLDENMRFTLIDFGRSKKRDRFTSEEAFKVACEIDLQALRETVDEFFSRI